MWAGDMRAPALIGVAQAKVRRASAHPQVHHHHLETCAHPHVAASKPELFPPTRAIERAAIEPARFTGRPSQRSTSVYSGRRPTGPCAGFELAACMLLLLRCDWQTPHTLLTRGFDLRTGRAWAKARLTSAISMRRQATRTRSSMGLARAHRLRCLRAASSVSVGRLRVGSGWPSVYGTRKHEVCHMSGPLHVCAHDCVYL